MATKQKAFLTYSNTNEELLELLRTDLPKLQKNTFSHLAVVSFKSCRQLLFHFLSFQFDRQFLRIPQSLLSFSYPPINVPGDCGKKAFLMSAEPA